MKRTLPVILFLCLCAVIFFLFKAISPFVPFYPFLNYLLGRHQPTSYLILLGNDAEMRANGGFTGSYAKITLRYPQYEIAFQDIYVPNGQLKGYVAPPPPIQQAFQHGTWELANADWEPDFPTSAQSIRWFMEKGGEINPDILAIVNLTTIKKILNHTGSFTVPEYQAEITPENVYLFLQGKAELDFFPGSTQKKDALTAVGRALVNHLHSLPLSQKIKIAQALHTDLQNQNIVIHSRNDRFQQFLRQKNFAGELISNTPDTYLLVETNLGANKANAYLQRQTVHTITTTETKAEHSVTLSLTNTSPEKNPNPPFHYGGDYLAYLRFYLPPNAENIHLASASGNLSVSPQTKFNLTELGFFLTTPAQGHAQIKLTYTLPLKSAYALTLLKQHGFPSSPQTINLNGQVSVTDLTNDILLK